jgi:hypothetical protein
MKAFWELIGLALFVALCCAMCGGISYGGKHHQIKCDCDKGVGIE